MISKKSRNKIYRYQRFFTVILFFITLATTTGCATFDQFLGYLGIGDSHRPDTAESLAMEGMEAYNHGRYEAAVTILQDLKDRYPFSDYSLLAELKIADCRYFLGNYSEAIVLYEEFENNHPTNEAVPYIMFQIGMCYYRQIDTIDRDPAGAYNAIQAFARLLRTYPDSPYTEETKAKIKAAKNFLAHHEFYIADFYLRTKEYKQAEGRLEYLLAQYPDAEVAPQAKEILTAIQSGNPPQMTWRAWIPEFSLPDWKTFSSGLSFGAGGQPAPAP